MAHRDSKQGFAFVYVDAQKMIDRAKQQPVEGPLAAADPGKAQQFNFSIPTPSQKSPEAVRQIRQNLDRLQALHHKLHAMLAELNDAAGKKKSDDS